ncbi:MAG: RNA polymerase sigma factor [Planctomycetaceae bacterium]
MGDEDSHDTLHELAKRFQSGDENAFRQLHALLHRDVRNFLVTRTPKGTSVDDLLQEVWVRVWSRRATYRNDNIRAWVFEIARNLLIDLYRRKGRAPVNETLGERDFAEVVRENSDDRKVALLDCIESVGGDFVAVWRMRIDGLTTEEIATAMKINVATVYTRAKRGEDQLRECIERKIL